MSVQSNISNFKRLPPEEQSVNSLDALEKCVFNDISVIEVDPVKSAPMDDKTKEVKDAVEGPKKFPFCVSYNNRIFLFLHSGKGDCY